jgi:hypothetical protein
MENQVQQTYRSHDPELATLLRQAKAIKPDVRFVIVEISFGDINCPLIFWAHSDKEAWSGYSPDALLEDIRASLSLEAA